jgi:alanyl-tRNA synthetase
MSTGMTSKEIRQQFLEFFESKAHAVVASAPMVIKDDPTLMFTNAGMNQFKDLFLGNKEPRDPRVADTQKCLRVSGKHNDLEEVGHDTYHHTMFEMLGNWSFGDYFKKEAIDWAWELLTKVYKIDEDRLYATVFGGDKTDDLEADEEARTYWSAHMPSDRILNGDKKDNFWEMGDSGPCGPCSEIHVDIRTDEDRKKIDGRELVNQDHPEVVELWNLVFMQFNRKANGSLESLPARHVDTGMGFERLCMVLQGVRSNYDTDVFQPIIRRIETIAHTRYGQNKEKDIAMRVIADHLRAVSFAIADGQLPSNTGAGYVIRRILRRAVRYGFTFLNLDQAFLTELSAVLEDEMGDAFPELRNQSTIIEKVLLEEENSFLRTLEQGLNRLEQIMQKEKNIIDGRTAFELYDTYGFPIDLTQLIARENRRKVDMEGFKSELQKQKERSRAATNLETGDWTVLEHDEVEEFVGYDQIEVDVRITRYRKVTEKKKTFYQLVFNLTPFYAESGGQVGDKGHIEKEGKKTFIFDTKRENNLIVHYANELPEDPGGSFRAVVNGVARNSTALNHSATHLLHAALREVLGDHVEQKGSLVHPDYLRFDFSHFSKMTDEELRRVEDIINQHIRHNHPLEEKRGLPISEAQKMGAMALFGEKYGDVVRVIQFGDSIELCGGTHVAATGDIGLLTIVSEGAIAAGIRRIEAYTGEKALDHLRSKADLLQEIQELLKQSPDPVRSIQNLQDQNSTLKKEIDQFRKERAGMLKGELTAKKMDINGIHVMGLVAEMDPETAKDLVHQLRQEPNSIIAIGTMNNGKAGLTIGISQDLLDQEHWHAGNMVRMASKHIQGGGGGQAHFATAGGKNPSGLEEALKSLRAYIETHNS